MVVFGEAIILPTTTDTYNVYIFNFIGNVQMMLYKNYYRAMNFYISQCVNTERLLIRACFYISLKLFFCMSTKIRYKLV